MQRQSNKSSHTHVFPLSSIDTRRLDEFDNQLIRFRSHIKQNKHKQIDK